MSSSEKTKTKKKESQEYLHSVASITVCFCGRNVALWRPGKLPEQLLYTTQTRQLSAILSPKVDRERIDRQKYIENRLIGES